MYKWKDKEQNLSTKNKYMLTRTISMFDYEGLPKTIPEDELEKMLQTHGYAFITEVEGDLYAFTGSFGGELDVYDNHTEITINNVALKFNKTLNILDDGVLMVNDDLQLGLNHLYNYYNSFLVENDITLLLDNINNRIQTLISATDDNTVESAKEFLENIYDGDLGVIADNAIFEGLKVNNTQRMSTSTNSLIEFQQYIKATLFNEVGLNANFNMKRERLTAGEVEMNAENLYPLVDNMLHVREEKLEFLNEKYDLNVTVEFGSVWAKTDLLDLDGSEIELDETEIETIETEIKPDETVIETDETVIETDDETDNETDEDGNVPRETISDGDDESDVVIVINEEDEEGEEEDEEDEI